MGRAALRRPGKTLDEAESLAATGGRKSDLYPVFIGDTINLL